MKFKTFSLTPSQSASVLIILGLVGNAVASSWSEGRIDWNKFVPALAVGVVGYCRSLSAKNSGGPADSKAAEVHSDTADSQS